MSDKTHIQWADSSWNVATGCSKVGLGCAHCYAERHWPRLSGNKATKYHGRKFSDVRCHPEELDTPLRWKKPRRIFVPSMGDLFHPSVPEVFVAAVFGVMALCPQHTFLVLTKRPTRLQYWVKFIDKMATSALPLFPNDPLTWRRAHCLYAAAVNHGVMPSRTAGQIEEQGWPLPNVWLGVSCEDQATADERTPILVDTPAAHRFLSLEPLLEEIDLSKVFGETIGQSVNCTVCGRRKQPSGRSAPMDTAGSMCDSDCTGYRAEPFPGQLWPGETMGDFGYPGHGLDWVIIGGESGPKARPCNIEWIRSIVQQCKQAAVPCFVKQVHLNGKLSINPDEWPEDIRTREIPE
jgi:protein gp37